MGHNFARFGSVGANGKMRTSKDEYINPLGLKILLGQNEQSEEFIKTNRLKLYNGYDYQNQCWIHNGERDTRTLEELKAAINN